MYCVVDSVDRQFWGPYTKLALAEKVLKFVQKAVDEEARIEFEECDPNEKEIQAGLLPIKISLDIRQGIAQEPEVEVCWPLVKEGIAINLPGYREYYFWAKNRTDAILKMARCKVQDPEPAQAPRESEEERDPLEELMEA